MIQPPPDKAVEAALAGVRGGHWCLIRVQAPYVLARILKDTTAGSFGSETVESLTDEGHWQG